MKHEWKKMEKSIYLPPKKPVVIDIPEYKYFSLSGEGNPNDDFFVDYVQTLYGLSYGARMSYKQGFAPSDYFEYTVYPLEGLWDLKEEAKNKLQGPLNKDDLVFQIMIRQPDFLTAEFAEEVKNRVSKKKPQLKELINRTELISIKDGLSMQMLHVGSYDDEPASFQLMEDQAAEQGYERSSLTHREIYLSDARKVEPAKLKTVLRFKIDKV